jgi:hypothetical protein
MHTKTVCSGMAVPGRFLSDAIQCALAHCLLQSYAQKVGGIPGRGFCRLRAHLPCEIFSMIVLIILGDKLVPAYWARVLLREPLQQWLAREPMPAWHSCSPFTHLQSQVSNPTMQDINFFVLQNNETRGWRV